MEQDKTGRVGKPTGLPQAEPQERLGPSGFDPARSSPETLRRAARECSGHEPSLSLLQIAAEAAADRIEDAEIALKTWDQGGDSEYWLRYSEKVSAKGPRPGRWHWDHRPPPGRTNDDPMCINCGCPSAFSCRRFSQEPHQGGSATIFIDPEPKLLNGLLCEDFDPDCPSPSSGWDLVTTYRISVASLNPVIEPYQELRRKHYRWRWLARLVRFVSGQKFGAGRISAHEFAFWRTDIVPCACVAQSNPGDAS